MTSSNLYKHHILPRHAGGSDDPSNIELVTLEEHIQRHKERFLKYGSPFDRIAAEALSGQIGKEEIIREVNQENGKLQGTRNRSSGHIQRAQKLTTPNMCTLGGKKTIALKKGAFGNTIQRLVSASKGGKVQGRKNAATGHLKRITSLSKKSLGKRWITDGKESKQIDPNEPLERGWKFGRTVPKRYK